MGVCTEDAMGMVVRDLLGSGYFLLDEDATISERMQR